MPEIEITHLAIKDSTGQVLPNRFFCQSGESSTLAVMLPGLNYSCDMPLLYYPARLLIQRGADVLQVHSDYTRPAFQSMPPQQQVAWLGADAQATLQSGLKRRGYSHLVLVGKSIGTLALAFLVAKDEAPQALTLWLTPLLRQPWLVEVALRLHSPALFVAGTGDATYDPQALERIRQTTGVEAILLEGANHSLEYPGDLMRSLQYIQEVIRGIEGFLDRELA